MVVTVCESVGNIVEKGENAGPPASSPLLTKFLKGLTSRVIQTQDFVVKSLFSTKQQGFGVDQNVNTSI